MSDGRTASLRVSLSTVLAHHGERLAAFVEWAFIVSAVVVYALTFDLGSPVNGLGGVEEVFDQDSRYVLRALGLGIPYEWNAQNHILYHFLTERGFGLLAPLVGTGMPAAFAFLKVFTAATGLCFLLLLRRLFIENGLSAPQRFARLVLGAFAVSLWFHFSAFETFGLAMVFNLSLLVALYRRLELGDASLENRVLLVGSLLFAFWTRSDQIRLAVGVGVAMLLPGAKQVRRSLLVDLFAFAALAPLGFSLIAWAYYGTSPADAFGRLAAREDHAGLDGVMMTWDNLKPQPLWRSVRANGLYSFVMPLATHVSPFSANTSAYFREPLSLFAPVAMSIVLARTAWCSARTALSGNTYELSLWFMWISGTLFYAWFDAHEPFLWCVQFGVLTLAALGTTGKNESRRATSLVLLAGVLVALHNVFYFAARYQ